jgi:Protein of unknown function (DUF1549)/Protein of unknown function (DUF1553)
MIGTSISTCGLRRFLPRGSGLRVVSAVVMAGLVATGSVALSFEPTEQDQGAALQNTGNTNPQAKQPAKTKKGQAGKKAGAVQKKKGAGGKAEPEISVELPPRPAKTVTSPTITSAELDKLIAKHLATNDPKVEPATLTSDIEFVRRIYFDLAGRPPTPEQVQLFVRDHAKDKRAQLIDALLTNPEYARNWAKYWRDVIAFHATNEATQRIGFDHLEDWMAKRLASNTPWDEIVSGMITATGRNDQNGAVALTLAHEARPVELAGEVSRIFMGVQIQCAQCHDHKTDQWKRRQFHEFAAFFAGVQPKQVEAGGMGQPPVIAVEVRGSRRYQMPDMNDPKKLSAIAPRFFLAKSQSKPEPALPETISVSQRRERVASYITGQDNPWFAQAYINRVWYALMGEAFYEPIDDIGPERTPKAPEVMEPLAAQWQKGGYDIRWLFRLILNTEAYQRRVRSTYNAAGKTPFASSCPSRLRADQVFDALVQALALPTDASGNLALPANPKAAQGKNAQIARQNLGLGDPKRVEKAAQKQGAAKKKAEAIGLASQVTKKAAGPRPGGPRALFDRLFGVDPSIANEDVMGTIPQALFLMNSPLINNRVQARPGTVLGELLTTAPNERVALEALYLRVLSRHPTKQEIEICGKYLSNVGNVREGFEDIYWSLINTTEFLTRR